MSDASPSPTIRLRRGRTADFRTLHEIERDAASIFSLIGYDFAANGPVRDDAELRRGLTNGALIVAEVDATPAGFALLWIIDARAHLAELAVAPSFQRLGVGGRLIAAAVAWGEANYFTEITLTCFKEVRWNAPFYERLGWREIPISRDRPELATVAEIEALAGFAQQPRIAMARPLGAQ